MKEYEIYLPMTTQTGAPIDPAEIDRLKGILAKAFGGYTYLHQRSEGAWSVAGITFHDEITILRVLDMGETEFDMSLFKKSLEQGLKQEKVLIVERNVVVFS